MPRVTQARLAARRSRILDALEHIRDSFFGHLHGPSAFQAGSG